MNLLMTSVGKRIELTEHLKSRFRVIGVDASPDNAGRYFTDAFYQVPRCNAENYVEELLTVCQKEAVSLLVPLYEPEFAVLSAARERFAENGVMLVLSEKQVLTICNDKRETAAFFEKYDIPAPGILSAGEIQDIIAGKDTGYPLVIKPAKGMGSDNIFFAKNREELAFFSSYVKNAIVQECVAGEEYTIDVLCDFSGEPVYIVPRIRLEVRAGEVTKSRVELQECVIRETKRLLAALNAEGTVKGPMTVQCFLEKNTKNVCFLEINPRFGGGVPLAFAAGADYAGALAEMGRKLTDSEMAAREKVNSEKENRMGENAAHNGGGGTAKEENAVNLADFRKKEIRELTMFRYTQAVYLE